MVEIHNTEVVNRISEEIKESNIALLPRTLANVIQPVLEVSGDKRKNTFVKNTSKSTTGTKTLLTASSTQDTYIDSASMGFTCDATADSVAYILQLTADTGPATNVINIVKETTTATRDHQNIIFNPPLKLKRGTNVLISQTFTVGTSTQTGTITGYVEDVLQK